jgi:FkbM family methyltransferase
MKDKIKNWLLRKIKNISYSKEGEDLQLNKLLQNRFDGYFVDIGCWHPIKASNSYFFYLKGFNGICIDPNPELVKLYQTIRPRDKFFNYGIGENIDYLSYYEFDESSMNTFDLDFIKNHKLENRILRKSKIEIVTLEFVLEESKIPHDKIDFFDIDVEGFDLNVLKTNNWNKYRPKIVLIESDTSFHSQKNSEINIFLEDKGYECVAKIVQKNHFGNAFYLRKDLF